MRLPLTGRRYGRRTFDPRNPRNRGESIFDPFIEEQKGSGDRKYSDPCRRLHSQSLLFRVVLGKNTEPLPLISVLLTSIHISWLRQDSAHVPESAPPRSTTFVEARSQADSYRIAAFFLTLGLFHCSQDKSLPCPVEFFHSSHGATPRVYRSSSCCRSLKVSMQAQ